jgi:hypothetical protein
MIEGKHLVLRSRFSDTYSFVKTKNRNANENSYVDPVSSACISLLLNSSFLSASILPCSFDSLCSPECFVGK